jgi:hypothetical protein
VLQQKIHTLFPTIAGGVMQWGILVLIHSIYGSTRLKEDLRTLELEFITQNKQGENTAINVT